MKLKKCHEISNKGVSVHKDHFDPIKYLRTPTTKKEAKKFLGTVFYLFQSICQKFCRIGRTNHKNLRNNVKFLWEESQIRALEKLKHEIKSAKPLAFPNCNQNFMLQADASNIDIGAVLMQQLNGQITPIYCLSRMLTACEQKYSTTKREALAVIF